MKKLLTFLISFFLFVNGFSQVRLTEAFPVDHQHQYIELFAKGTPTGYDLGNYFIVSYLKNRTTGIVTVYLIDFNAGENPFINNSYAVYSKYTGDKVPPNTYAYKTFGSSASITKYTKTGTTNYFTVSSMAANEDYFSDTQDEMAIFLFKKTGYAGNSAAVIDFVASVKVGGSQTTKIGFINASLDSLPVLNHDGVNFDLRPVLVSKAKHVNENLGQSSYNLRLENCIPVWYKDPRTPNSGQFIDDVPTWDAFSFYYPSTGMRTIDNTIEHYMYTTSGVIPQTSLSYISLQTTPPISASFECYLNFRYLINADISNVRVTLYTDLNGNHLIDPGDAVINGYDSIVPTTLPVVTHDGEYFYKLNFQLTRVSVSGSSFYPVLIQTEYAITNGDCTFNTFEEIIFADIQALPVRLGGFSIEYQPPSVQLKWNTVTETNNRGFQIERSLGLPDRWYPIAFVGTKAKDGNSNSSIDYQYDDHDIQLGMVHFYRLNQIDFDGSDEYSPVRKIKPASNDLELSVFPNPALGDVMLEYKGFGAGQLTIINNNGQIILQKRISIGKTKLEKLYKGTYILRVVEIETGQLCEKKLIVQE